MLLLVTLSMLTAAPPPMPEVEATAPAWGANLSMNVGAYLLGFGGDIGVERRLTEHVSIEARFGGSYSSQGSFTNAFVAITPGVRYYFASVFRGGWLGVQMQVGAQGTASSLSGLGGLGGLGGISGTPTGEMTWAYRFGGAALLGWTFRWDNGFTLALSAGPTASMTRPTTVSTGTLAIGLQGSLGFGLSF